MKIQILNKNIENSIAKIYEVDEAPVLTEVFNETLDSGTVVISNQTSIIEIEPYDIVVLMDDSNTVLKYMCVDTYTESLVCVNPKIYRYEITLFSETKQLEGTVLPNLKITKVWDETRSVYYYINQYMSEYAPKVRIEVEGSLTYVEKFDWTYDDSHNGSPDLEEKFSMQCPEMQWNTPTLREVLNDLMMVADCIPTIKNGRLEFLDLTKVNEKNWLDDNHLNYITKSKSSEDYVSELQCELVNVTNNIETVNNLVTKSEWVMFSPTDDGVVLKNDNMVLKTAYPIYNLKSLVAHFEGAYVVGADATNTWMTQDITDIVCEYQEWITKKVLYNTDSPDFEEFGDSQNWSVYYTRGTNEIRNWNHKTKFWWQDKFLYDELFDKIIRYQHPDVNPGSSVTKPYWYTIFFKIEYETLAGCLFRASKSDYPEHSRIVIDNQTNSMVDSYNQGFLEYQKANRLGNEQLQINARFNSSETLMKIGDVYDDSIIYQCQYQYFKNHIEVNAVATKNYVLREYFTGVKSKIRSWQVADESQACRRHDLTKYYCEFSYLPHQDVTISAFSGYEIAFYLMSPVYEYESAPIKYVFVQSRAFDSDTGFGNIWYPLSNRYYVLDLISRIVGSSLVFTYEFRDNFWACQSLDTNIVSGSDKFTPWGEIIPEALIEGEGFPLVMKQYTNSIGELNKLYAIYSTDIINSPYSGDWVDGEDVRDDQDKAEAYVYNLWQMPEVSEVSISNDKFASSIEIHKDSQETISVSTQFEFCSDTTDISVGKQWILKQRAINLDENLVNNYRLAFYNSSKYNVRDANSLPSSGLLREKYAVVHSYADGSNCAFYIVYKDNGYSTAEQAENMAVYYKSQAVLYLYDNAVNSQNVLLTLNNVPDGNCFGVKVLPDWADTYQELTYIQNSGKQYLNLGFVPDADNQWSFELDYTDVTASGSNYVMGSRVSGGTIYFGVTGASATKAITIANTDLTKADNYRQANRRYNVSSVYTASTDGTCTLTNVTDNETYSGHQNVSLSGASANVCLFALNSSNIHSGIRVHSLKVYKGATLFRDLVPAKRISDNVLGMYDKKNDVFYTNAGNGTFTAGTEVDNGLYYPGYLVHMNILRTRNKNIYSTSNHYLIVDKI